MGGFPPYTRNPPQPLFLRPGAYTIAAPGAADIGSFSLKLRVPRPILWTNRDAVAEIDRPAGVTLAWRAARKDSAVVIAAGSADPFSGDAAACICIAAARDGLFTIPAMALANLPATTEDGKDFSYLLVSEVPAYPRRIHARGLDGAFAAYLSVSIRQVRYK
jgi:hypothetical protein